MITFIDALFGLAIVSQVVRDGGYLPPPVGIGAPGVSRTWRGR